jgi:hypothetical protein
MLPSATRQLLHLGAGPLHEQQGSSTWLDTHAAVLLTIERPF